MLNLDGIHEDDIAEGITNLRHVHKMMQCVRFGLSRVNRGRFEKLDEIFNIWAESRNSLSNEYLDFYNHLTKDSEVGSPEYNRLLDNVWVMSDYLYFRKEAMNHRKEGNVDFALEVENRMESLYDRLSDDFRW